MSLGDEVLRVAKPYLGLAAKDVLVRVSRNLVGVDLAQIDRDQLHSLAYWVFFSASRLMSRERAHELAERIREVNGQ